jgi:hypothetical protein
MHVVDGRQGKHVDHESRMGGAGTKGAGETRSAIIKKGAFRECGADK